MVATKHRLHARFRVWIVQSVREIATPVPGGSP